MSVRLSDKQRSLLEQVAMSETPSYHFPEGLPLYAGHMFMSSQFNTEGERQRWLENLEDRGLISRAGNGRCFIHLTKAGRAAITKP